MKGFLQEQLEKMHSSERLGAIDFAISCLSLLSTSDKKKRILDILEDLEVDTEELLELSIEKIEEDIRNDEDLEEEDVDINL